MRTRISVFRIDICEYKNPPLRTRNWLILNFAKFRDKPKRLDQGLTPVLKIYLRVNYKDWQPIGQEGMDIGRLESPVSCPAKRLKMEKWN